MLVVFSFCHKDSALALKQARWVKELGGANRHNALIVCNKLARKAGMEKPILDVLSSAFNFVDVFTPHDEDEEPSTNALPHSRPANHLWYRTVQFIRDEKQDVPFTWMETDAIPLKSIWLDSIETQFMACRKFFMGDLVKVDGVPPHMSGVAVYHQTWLAAPAFACVQNTAWDVALCNVILPQFHQTKLIQHDWRPRSFESAKDLERLRPEAVIYHQCKDGSLIEHLQIQRMGEPASMVGPHIWPTSMGETRGSLMAERPVHRGEVAGSIPAPETSAEISALKNEICELKKIIETMGVFNQLPTIVSRTKGKPMKKKRAISPERRKSLAESLEKARAKKRELAMK